MKYVYGMCGYMCDEVVEDTSWVSLDSAWKCPSCIAPEECFRKATSEEDASTTSGNNNAASLAIQKNIKKEDTLETSMSLIHEMAIHNASHIKAIHAHKSVPEWDDILLLGRQLAHPPLADKAGVGAIAIIEKNVRRPMALNHAVYVSHIPFGALSKEAKTALAKGIAAVHTAQCSERDGILPDRIDHAYEYIFEYVSNRYSVIDENPRRSDAIGTKIGQGSKPGIGGHPPAKKITEEMPAIREKPLHQGIISPPKLEKIRTRDDLEQPVTPLRKHSEGRPIGIKIAVRYIETDLEWIACAQPDFITINGRGGATGASPKYLKDNSTAPTVCALTHAHTYMNQHRITQELIITGGFRISGEMIKALAMGADAIAITSAAMITIGCQQYRICHSEECPMGIITQDPELRKNFSIGKGTKRLKNYLHILREKLKSFARISGHTCIRDLSREDLCATSSEISNRAGIPHC